MITLNTILKADFDSIYSQYGNEFQSLKGSEILITGANGMMAGYLSKFLIYLNTHHSFGLKLFGLVRTNPERPIEGMNYLLGDVCNVQIKDIRFDHIIHSASFASPIYYGSHPIETSLPNVEGTINLLRFSENMDLKSFVFISSSEVYGAFSTDKEAILENEYGYVDPMNQRACYSESKRMGENLCTSWFHQKKTPIKVVRPFHTYGPGLRRNDGRVYADFIYSIVDKKNITLNSKGEAKRAFCYLSDATAGILLIMLSGKSGEAYNLGNPQEEWSIYEAAEKAAGSFPDRSLKVTINEAPTSSGYLKSKVLRNCPSISKIQALGWNPQVTLTEGFKRTVRYIETEGALT